MIHGYHVILPMYGFWLPNDPRGSWSDYVRRWELVRFGEANRKLERRSSDELTPEELREREAAISALQYPPVSISGKQALLIATAFGDHARRNRYTLWACSVLPEHTHLVIARHRFKVERMVIQLKGAATRGLVDAGLHPIGIDPSRNNRVPPMWASRQWKVYLDSELDIEQAIHYVEQNPVKEGKKFQKWNFVTPFAGVDGNAWVTYH